MGAPRRNADPDLAARIDELHGGGTPIAKIANTLGISSWTVLRTLDQSNTPRVRHHRRPKRKPKTVEVPNVPKINYVLARRFDLDQRDARVLALTAAGLDANAVGEIVGLSVNAVRNMLSRRIYPRLRAANAAGAVHACHRLGIFLAEGDEDVSTWADATEATQLEIADRVVRERSAGKTFVAIARDLTYDGHAMTANGALHAYNSAAGRLRDEHGEILPGTSKYPGATLVRELMRELAAARRRAGLTQAQAGEKIGLTQADVSDLERGIRDPKISLVVRYAEAVGAHITISITQSEPAAPPDTESVAPQGHQQE